MSIGANSSQEQINATYGLDLALILLAFGLEIWRVPVQDVDVGGLDVYMREEVLVHEAMVALWVITRNADVLVHVEGNDIFKRDVAGFVFLDQALIDFRGTAACGKAQDKWLLGCWCELLYPANDVFSNVRRGVVGRISDDKTHLSPTL